MGIGDQILATGMARGAKDRSKRIGFGDGSRILWDKHSEEIFRHNPNIAAPGSESAADVEWIGYHKGSRLYNTHDRAMNRWVWNMEFRPVPGEIFFSSQEINAGERHGRGFVVVEPDVPYWKSSAPNKDWGRSKYQIVVNRLQAAGARVVQMVHSKGAAPLLHVEPLFTRSFREALAVLRNAALYIGPEGGLHHGAAAVGIPAVVLFGGFIPPAVTGYETHKNLTGGAEACGSLSPCEHCRKAMDSISTDEVFDAARGFLNG